MSELTKDQIVGRIIALEERVKKLESSAPPPQQSHGKTLPFPVNIDDPQWGDPDVRFDPRDWKGKSHKGMRFSQCPPEYLQMLASAYDYFADKADRAGEVDKNGKPKATWDRLSAAKARAWAERNSGAVSSRDVGGDDEQDDLF